MSSIEYIVIIYYTDFVTRIRRVKSYNIKQFVDNLNNSDEVFDYTVCTEVDDYDFKDK